MRLNSKDLSPTHILSIPFPQTLEVTITYKPKSATMLRFILETQSVTAVAP